MIISLLNNLQIATSYKVCGYEKNDGDDTIVKYSLRNKRSGILFRKSASDILKDKLLIKNFDSNDLIEITTMAQMDSISNKGTIDPSIISTFQRSRKAHYIYFPYLVSLTVMVFCYMLLLGHRFITATIFDTKLILPGAIIIFPIIYFMADLIQEVYGYARLRQTLWVCIIVHLIIGILTTIIMSFPSAQFINDDAYHAVMDVQWRMIVANDIAMILGFTVNGIILAKLKIKFNGKHLWLRSITSTLLAEFIYSYSATTLSFYGYLQLNDLLKMQISIVIIKVLWEIFATPFLYIASSILKESEGIDVYDYYTNFNPFSWKL